MTLAESFDTFTTCNRVATCPRSHHDVALVSAAKAGSRQYAEEEQVSPFVVILFACLGFIAGLAAPLLLKKIRSKHRSEHVDGSSAAPLDTLHYARKVGQFSALPSAAEIVFVGDSRIEHADWNELLDTSGVRNRGISGDTTSGVVQRLAVSVPGAVRICVIQVGVNDAWRGVPAQLVRQNLEQIVRFVVQERGAHLLLTAVVFVDSGRAMLNSKIAELNSILVELSQQRGVHWIDLNSTLAPDGYLQSSFTDDGTHFTGAGYRAISDPLQKKLAEIRIALDS